PRPSAASRRAAVAWRLARPWAAAPLATVGRHSWPQTGPFWLRIGPGTGFGGGDWFGARGWTGLWGGAWAGSGQFAHLGPQWRRGAADRPAPAPAECMRARSSGSIASRPIR